MIFLFIAKPRKSISITKHFDMQTWSTTLFQQPSNSNKTQVKNLHEVRMIRKGKIKYQSTLESFDSSCDITISYQTMYYKNQIVSTYNTNWCL